MMADGSNGMSRFLRQCAETSARGTVWIALGAAFLALGVSGSSGAYIGLGAAFLVIGLGRLVRTRRRRSE
jgi:hypothetical protein